MRAKNKAMNLNSQPKNAFGFVTHTRTIKEFINDLQHPQVAVNQNFNIKKMDKDMNIEPAKKDFMEEFLKECKEHEAMIKESNSVCGLFKIQTANDWIQQAKNKPIPKMLFDEFWHEGEVCCLFASSNVGKSILAVQIANSISKGQAIKGFRLGTSTQKVLYFDFELSGKQFEGRYSKDYQEHYLFDDNFFRIEFDTQMVVPDNITFEEYLNNSIEKAIQTTSSKVLVIDNLTYLRNETEKSKDALALMKYLKALKSKHSLSILVLAHTPKRDFSRPLTQNDLMGSSMLGNFFDSCFTIGASAKDKSMRYIKQIKVRECEKKYDAENVINCQIIKHSNFVEFESMGFGDEMEHLREVTDKDKSEVKEQAKELSQQGLSNREIARRCSVSEGAVRKWLKT